MPQSNCVMQTQTWGQLVKTPGSARVKSAKQAEADLNAAKEQLEIAKKELAVLKNNPNNPKKTELDTQIENLEQEIKTLEEKRNQAQTTDEERKNNFIPIDQRARCVQKALRSAKKESQGVTSEPTYEDLQTFFWLTIENCEQTTLTAQDLQGLPNLRDLEIVDGKFGILDLSPIPQITTLRIGFAPKLTKIKFSDQTVLKTLALDNVKITSLTELIPQTAITSKIEILSLGSLSAVETIDFSAFSSLMKIEIMNLETLDSLDFSKNQKLSVLYLYNTPSLRSLDIQTCPKITDLNLSDTGITEQSMILKYNPNTLSSDNITWGTAP